METENTHKDYYLWKEKKEPALIKGIAIVLLILVIISILFWTGVIALFGSN